MPEPAADFATIIDTYNNGLIGKADVDFLAKQHAEMSTPEGAALAQQKQRFVLSFTPVPDPASPDAEATATAQRYQLEKALAARVDRTRAAGKDPADLFDPATPDHIASPFDLVPQFAPRAGLGEAAAQPAAQVQAPADTAAPPFATAPITPADSTSSSDNATLPQPGSATLPEDQDSATDAFEAAAERIRNSVLNRQEGVGTDVVEQLIPHVLKGFAALFDKGREVFGPPPAPEKPGFWSEQDEIRRQEFEQKKIEFAADTAMMLLLPARDEGNVGVGPRRPRTGRPSVSKGGGDPNASGPAPLEPASARLTRGGRKQIKNLLDLADMTVAEAIRARGGGGSQVTQIRRGLELQKVRDVADLAAQGNEDAVHAIKMIKRGDEKAQRTHS